MSNRYQGAWLQNGSFDPLASPPAQLEYELYSWGNGTNGALGLGNTTSYSSPKQVGSLSGWEKIGIGSAFSLAIRKNGTLWSWGGNSSGELGLGNTTNYSSPKQVGALTNWLNIAVGTSFFVAIKTDGTLWSCGANASGQLGLGNTTNYSSPKQVGSLTNWSKVSCANQQVLAIKTDGTLWAWGKNNSAYGTPYGGQLGLGNFNNYSSPAQVGSLNTWLNIAGGAYHSLATKTDGTLWSWGMNSEGTFGGTGQLGLGNNTSYNSPKQVGALTNWLLPFGGSRNSAAIKTDGTLWSWGENSSGQLGLGNRTYYSSPKQVGSLTNWNKLSSNSGARNVFAIKTDGTLWSWGENNAGQLGLGNTTYYSSPKQVGSLTTWVLVSTGTHTVALG